MCSKIIKFWQNFTSHSLGVHFIKFTVFQAPEASYFSDIPYKIAIKWSVIDSRINGLVPSRLLGITFTKMNVWTRRT